MHGLRVLAVVDEARARADLAYLLEQDDRIEGVRTAADGAEALRVLQSEAVDAVFLDVRMPSLDGDDLAGVLRRFAQPPAIVFVSAYDDHTRDAFGLSPVDYVLTPVRAELLGDALDRVVESRRRTPAPAPTGRPSQTSATDVADDETIAVELAGVTRFVRRRDVRFVEAHGDYARLVTAEGGHLVRIPLSVLAESWASAGFVRIHRRWLVSLAAVDEVRIEGGRMSVRVGGAVLDVSRRQTRELRDRLVRSARLRRPVRA